MFLYYQKTDDQKAVWLSAPDHEKYRKELAEQQSPMITILSVSKVIDRDDMPSPADLKYRGPLYFDIDNEDINVSIESAQDLVEKLIAQGVDVRDIDIWLSGKKGLHLTISAKVFSNARAYTYLPLIYMDMAQKFFVEGLDMAVYSAKRGRMWRQPNIKRANGKYKVPVTYSELKRLTPELYDQHCSEPRQVHREPQDAISTQLSAMFETSKKDVQKRLRMAETAETFTDEELQQVSDEAGCIQKLVHEGDKAGSNFNQAAMQLGAFIKSKYNREESDQWMKLVRTMADNVKSGSYKSKSDRISHIKGAVIRAFADPNFKFYKGALFSVIDKCGDCPICAAEVQKEQDRAEGKHLDQIETRDTGYYFTTDKVDKQLTTFTIEVDSYSSQESDDGAVRRTGVNGYILWGGERAPIRIDDDAWNSRSNFVRAVSGIGNLAVYANDIEIQKIKHHLFSRDIEMEEIHEVTACGIHWMKVGTSKTLVYVEPAFSISAAWEQGTHVLATDQIQAPPNFFAVPALDDTNRESVEEVLKALCKVNDPHIVAQVIGWMSACHIKQQIRTRMNQFPLLNFWGSASAGKSKTASLFSYLHGVDYEMDHPPLSLETTTPYAIPAMVGSSTTVPRILDECNQSQINRRVWDKLMGVLKAAWSGLADQRGTLAASGKSAKIVQTELTGPVLFLSEQPPDRPAVKTRSIMVGFTKMQREVPGREAAFLKCFDNRGLISIFGKSMLEKALHTMPKWCLDRMDIHSHSVPRELDTRAQYSYTVVLTGLDFFQQAAKDCGIDLDAEVDMLRRALIAHLQEVKADVSRDRETSETDLVLQTFALMAEQPEEAPIRLEAGRHYIRSGDDLMLNLALTFPEYGKWVRALGQHPIVRNPVSFEKLIKGEVYYRHSKKNPQREDEMFTVLSVAALSQKGIPTSYFVEES